MRETSWYLPGVAPGTRDVLSSGRTIVRRLTTRVSGADIMGSTLLQVIGHERSLAPEPRDRMEGPGGSTRASALPLPNSSCVHRR
jgi:hypothetical protein